MNYQKIYNQLVDKCKVRGLYKSSLQGYYEKHHIIPRCMGGLDEDDNFVLFTPREHVIAHRLLWKENPNNHSLMWAYTRTVNSHKGILTSREVEMAKIAKAKVMSERVVSDETREKIRKTLTGHKIPQEVIEKRRKKQIGQKRSDETKQKLSEKRQELIANGWTMPEDAREKIGNAARGRKMSDEAKEKISEFNKGKVIPETTRKALSEYQKALRPWEKSSCKARFARKKVWLEASESYGIWKENGEPKGWAFSSILSKLHEVEYKKYHFDKMLEMFSDGWIPNEDNDWLKFKEMYEQS